MASLVDLNADMAEGFGAYDIGNDAELLKIVTSANVACGFHAGDASTMRRTVLLAKELGVGIGAHPGFNDLWGFGRRQIRMRAEELEYMIAYQIAALEGMARYAGISVTHVKAHGALSNMAAVDESYAMAIGRAIKTINANLIYVAQYGTQLHRAAERLGLRVAREGYADRRYGDDGNLAPRSVPGTVLRDPAEAAAQALRLVQEGTAIAMSGKPVSIQVDTLCIHGDEPSAVDVAHAVRAGLTQAGVGVVPLSAMQL